MKLILLALLLICVVYADKPDSTASISIETLNEIKSYFVVPKLNESIANFTRDI